jgi:gliding motility-associated-like protein
MRKNYFFLLFGLAFLFNVGSANAQLVGTNCYLQGRYLEIGMNNNASFGTCSGIPPTYHPHTPGTGNLAEVYDWGKDGWATGTPPFMGDYTYPGSPFEGWELQIGGGRVQAFQNCAGTMTASVGGMTMTGNLTAYSNVGGRALGTWTGTATSGGATLAIRQVTRIDTLGSAVVVTTVLRNTSGVTAPNVYYMRSCDPDNAQSWSALGGGFPTVNRIVHQNEDARHRVLVKSYDQVLTEPKSYMGLGTKDCRAKSFIYTSWWLSSAVDLSTVWGGTYGPPGTGAQYTLGACLPVSCTPQDIAIGLVYNIGNIAAGDSAIVSYAYIFNGDAVGIDEAFPDPQIVLNGVPRPVVPVPFPNRDTFDVCAYPGMTSLPVDILNAEDKSWSWSKWTWSPGVGLSSTTGAHVTITTTALPPIITYTIVGTDSAHGMSSCLNKVFYLTILTCNGAESNSPCVGDTLWLNAPGDSVGATYQWFGPAPSTTIFATTQKAFIFPATAAHNGTFSVIKTKAGVPDTSITIVTIRHKPTVWASSNSPLCLGTGNTLLLTTVVDSPGVTYSWSKVPPSFSSTLANPTIPSFALSDTGIYRVIVTSVFGCKDTDQTLVTLVPPPAPPTVVAVTPYCQNDVFVPFTITGVVPGGIVLWYPSATGGVGSAVTPTVNTSIAGVNKFYFSQKVGSCEGLRDSITVVVNPLPAPIVGPSELCQYFSITKTNPTPGGVWSSSNPSIASIGVATGVVNGLLGGTVTISYTLPTTCRRTTVVTVHPKPAPPTFAVHRECQYVLGHAAAATGTSLTWYGLGVTAGSPVPPIPNTDTTPGVYNYYVTQTSPFGCVSDSALYPVRIYPEPTPPVVTDTTYCQKFQAPPLTAKGSNLLWYTSATSTPGSATAPIPSTATPGVTTYYVTQTVDQCESPRAGLTVTVLYLPDFKITPDRPWICQFDSMGFKYTGPSLVDPDYTWTLPIGASFAAGSDPKSTNVTIKFDTAWGQHYVYLMASNYKGRCATIDTVNIKVVPAPSTHMYHNPDVCLGDTITLALSDRSANAYKYTWTIDGVPMSASPIIDIITASSNSGGPFVISWHDSGRHILRIQGATVEGCKSQITADTVNVHINPDPTFTYAAPDKLCLEDSIHFWAIKKDYNCVYKWEPEHSFVNNGKPDIWGKAEQLRSMISLTVTDPFGCRATYTKQINTEPCCSVQFPNAFTPNGDDRNDHYRPIFQGYHRFHIFRVTNRWGQTVFETTNTNPYWDGTFNGLPQDMGVYFYYLKYDCGGKVMETKGDLTLIR